MFSGIISPLPIKKPLNFINNDRPPSPLENITITFGRHIRRIPYSSLARASCSQADGAKMTWVTFPIPFALTRLTHCRCQLLSYWKDDVRPSCSHSTDHPPSQMALVWWQDIIVWFGIRLWRKSWSLQLATALHLQSFSVGHQPASHPLRNDL